MVSYGSKDVDLCMLFLPEILIFATVITNGTCCLLVEVMIDLRILIWTRDVVLFNYC